MFDDLIRQPAFVTPLRDYIPRMSISLSPDSKTPTLGEVEKIRGHGAGEEI